MATDQTPCCCMKCKGTKRWKWKTIQKHMRMFGIWSGDGKNMNGADEDVTNFLEFVNADGRGEPLCTGSGISTTLVQGVSILLSLYSTYPGTSQAFMTSMFEAIATYFLPPSNILPQTFAAANKVVAPLLTPMEKFEMCRNKCVVYAGENVDLRSCPKCNEVRDSKYTVPYIPVIPRLRRWMSIPEVAKALQSHLPPVNSETERMTDIQQSPAFAASIERMGQDRRCIVFGLNTDGVDPFNHLHISYSMWPISLKTFNLPPEIRDAFGWNLLVTIIPGWSDESLSQWHNVGSMSGDSNPGLRDVNPNPGKIKKRWNSKEGLL